MAGTSSIEVETVDVRLQRPPDDFELLLSVGLIAAFSGAAGIADVRRMLASALFRGLLGSGNDSRVSFSLVNGEEYAGIWGTKCGDVRAYALAAREPARRWSVELRICISYSLERPRSTDERLPPVGETLCPLPGRRLSVDDSGLSLSTAIDRDVSPKSSKTG